VDFERLPEFGGGNEPGQDHAIATRLPGADGIEQAGDDDWQ